MANQPIDETTPFGKRVAERLRSESVVWLTTVGRDGAPQPNPVWFLWDGADGVVVYNAVGAHRMQHVKERPEVSLNFNSGAGGGDIVVLRGHAVEAPEIPASDQDPSYQAKYGAAIASGGWGTAAEFDRQYPHKLRVTIEAARGW
jgi:PPOX class probable F420-dependent enzyme